MGISDYSHLPSPFDFGIRIWDCPHRTAHHFGFQIVQSAICNSQSEIPQFAIPPGQSPSGGGAWAGGRNQIDGLPPLLRPLHSDLPALRTTPLSFFVEAPLLLLHFHSAQRTTHIPLAYLSAVLAVVRWTTKPPAQEGSGPVGGSPFGVEPLQGRSLSRRPGLEASWSLW